MDNNPTTFSNPDGLTHGEVMPDTPAEADCVYHTEALPGSDVFQHCNNMPDAAAEVHRVYESLPANSFRLLDIQHIDETSKNLDAELRCRMSIHAMDQCPSYVALSYTWGKPANDCEIILNDKRTKVRKNLWRFLREAKNLKAVKWLWIDALCINQQDYQERGQQVGIMAQIYRNAKSVLVWLGPAYGGSDKAMKGLALNATGKRAAKNFWEIGGLCNRAYWTRLWIFQEIILARDITLLCGSEIAPWQPFRANLLDPPAPKVKASSQYQVARNSPAASIVNRTDDRLDRIDLFDLMLHTKDLRCQESRDRIFALLSTGSRGCDSIVSDYNAPLPLLLNTVLKEHHRVTTLPYYLELIEDQCKQLDGLFDQDAQSSIFQLQGGKQPEPGRHDIAQYPLRRNGSSISLWWAVYYGHTLVVDLLREDDELNEIDAPRCLRQAAEKGSIATVRLLLEHGMDINKKRDLYDTALYIASNEGHFEIVQLLLERGAKHVKALIYASERGHVEIATLLLEHDYEPQTALNYASAEGQIEIVKLLLAHGADINAQGAAYGNALRAASYTGHLEVVKLLLGCGAEVNVLERKLGTAMQAASAGGHIGIVELLLEHDAEVNVIGGDYGTALQAASRGGHIEIVKLLLEHGGDVSAQGGHFGTSLQAASHGGHVEIVKLLLEHGGDVSAQGGHYGTALQASCATSESSIELVKLLLEHGASVTAQGGHYGTALQAACQNDESSIELVKLLLEHGADVNIRGGYYGTVLLSAVAKRKGSIQIVKLLIKHGADINAQNVYREAHRFARGDDAAQVQRLLWDLGARDTSNSGYSLDPMNLKTRQMVLDFHYMRTRPAPSYIQQKLDTLPAAIHNFRGTPFDSS